MHWTMNGVHSQSHIEKKNGRFFSPIKAKIKNREPKRMVFQRGTAFDVIISKIQGGGIRPLTPLADAFDFYMCPR